MKRKTIIFLTAAGALITPVLLSPLPRFTSPHSTVVESVEGILLGARIADDGQWRFPPPDSVPVKFEKALLTFEDRYFYLHPGINPVSVVRAVILNFRAGEIVSGGSTLAMQIARLAGSGRARTYPEKILEMFSALKLELFSSKKEILNIYAANAPFGGNIVGLNAAAWRYLGKSPDGLTWAEAASLAVLPNSPGLVFPGRNQERLRQRRDDLLRRMYEREFFDSLTLVLALEEPLPGEPAPMPAKAPHLTDFFYTNERGKQVKTTINAQIQERATAIINARQKELSGNFINNLACLIVSVESGEVLAYVGNSVTDNPVANGGDVDLIRSLRSTGSILKPFLYAGMQQAGDILPNSLIADIPTRFPGFSPKNFDMSYSGAVTASQGLAQSLNIPAVRMLRDFSPEKFLELLKKTGFTTFTRSADHYGLSLILGGGETSLWELTGAYASMSRILKNSGAHKGYNKEDIHPPSLVPGNNTSTGQKEETDPVLSASSIWLTYEALKRVNRPEEESGWQYFSSLREVAWKTGTSYGFRDAWAVGTTPDYVIGVWAGNADGEGRPGLTGISAAAPVLFDLINTMGSGNWFTAPAEELIMIRVCRQSGFRAGPDCPDTEEIPAGPNGLRSGVCPWHKIVHLDKSGRNLVNADCYPPSEIRNEPWFILPPAMEYYYRQKNPGYKLLPQPAPGCQTDKKIEVMEFLYPHGGARIFIPRDQSGQLTRIVPEIVHRKPSKKIFWHLDGQYAGASKQLHSIEIVAGQGEHTLTAVDEDGNRIQCVFTITGASGR